MLKPLYDKVVVKRVPPREQMTDSGLVLPTLGVEEKPWFEGIVLAVGNGRLQYDGTIIPLLVKEGDRVCWPKHSGFIFVTGVNHYVVLREDEILGIDNE